MLQLLLLRHGKASKNHGDMADFNRPLNKEGTAQVNQVGYVLRSHGVKVGQIISSSAVRTAETAEIANHFLKLPKIEFDDNMYNATRAEIFQKLSTAGKADIVMYVGHNEGISDLAGYLVGDDIEMSTGELITITFDVTAWKMITGQSGTLVSRLIPDVHSF